MHPERERDISMEKLKQGGVNVQTLALYVGGKPDLEHISFVFQRMFEEEKKLQDAGWRKLTDYRDARENETHYILSVEGCDLLATGGLPLLSDWRKKGVRMAALCWNYENALGTPAKVDQTIPLKPFGKEAVREMVRLGVAPDVSHLNERGFYDLLDMGVVPLASHSCCRALCGHRRNLTDDQLRALFEAGGYVGVNFYPCFLRDEEVAAISDICDHVLHMMEMGGEKQVGFGSDFDGIECKPDDMAGPQDFPALLSALRKRGLTEDQLAGLSGRNLMAYYDRIDPRA